MERAKGGLDLHDRTMIKNGKEVPYSKRLWGDWQ
jgi:hypothetical protein